MPSDPTVCDSREAEARVRSDRARDGTRLRRQRDGERRPWPVPALEAVNRPPCASTTDRLMARPSPRPPYAAAAPGPPARRR